MMRCGSLTGPIRTCVVPQVRNVLQLYVDVEHTGRDAEFIEKFEQRERMGELLSAPSASMFGTKCFAPVLYEHPGRAVLSQKLWQFVLRVHVECTNSCSYLRSCSTHW